MTGGELNKSVNADNSQPIFKPSAKPRFQLPMHQARPSRHPSILIIDDQMESVALLLQYFQGHAIEVMTALDGKDGIRTALLAQPDIILLDVMMTPMNGYEVCQELKQDSRTAHIPVIFLSASVTLNSKLNGLAVGAVDYICKPFSSEEVLARVFVHFNTSRQLNPNRTDQQALMATPSHDIQIIAEVVAHLQDPEQLWLGTESLARKIGLNEKKLNSIFRQQFGMTVSEYRLHQRLEGARWKLANTQQQIQTIGAEAGFNNPSDFSRAFRVRYGMGPRQYRQASNTQAPKAAPRQVDAVASPSVGL